MLLDKEFNQLKKYTYNSGEWVQEKGVDIPYPKTEFTFSELELNTRCEYCNSKIDSTKISCVNCGAPI